MDWLGYAIATGALIGLSSLAHYHMGVKRRSGDMIRYARSITGMGSQKNDGRNPIVRGGVSEHSKSDSGRF